MKKNYIIPSTMNEEAINIYNFMQTVSDPHINDEGNVEFPGGDGGGGNADDGCAKDRGTWSDGGLWTLLLMLMFFVASSMDLRAQSVTEPDMTRSIEEIHIALLNNTSVNYTSDIDSVHNLPGVGLKIYISTNNGLSVDYLYCQMSSVTYTYSSVVPPINNNVNANWNIEGRNIPQSKADPNFTNQSTDDWAWRLEYPHINTSSTSQRVVKATSDYGITYSLEWDNSKIANRWTVYTMCAKNMEKNTTRHDDFKSDPAVTTSPSSSYTESTTYSRGHLCPSADRLCSDDQNKQTFFMTNMQPQYQNHNGSACWAKLEEYVRDKWSPQNSNDTLYVVKAATIANVTLNGSSQSGTITTTTDGSGHTIPVPKYFYMAFLYYNKAGNSYQAFALWTEQKESGNITPTEAINSRISIDELETRTGIDFFCNLPDDIEATVEAAATYWDFQSNNAPERIDDEFYEIEDDDGDEDAEIAMW